MKVYDTAIIGGGAGGLMAAAELCRNKKDVIILDGNPRVGKKLLSTGAGRCNLSNTGVSSEKYRGQEKIPENFFKKYTCEYLREKFLKFGLLTREDQDGRVYPSTMQSSTVLDILRKNCQSADTVCEFAVNSIKSINGMFLITSQDVGEYRAKNVILSCGGMAGGGSTSGYDLAKMFSHSVSKLSPALCPVLTSKDSVRALKGIRCRGKVSLIDNGKIITQEYGEIQFTENSLSGICVFDVSRFANKGMTLSLDLLPYYSEDEIKTAAEKSGAVSEETFEGFVNKRVLAALLKSYKALHGGITDIYGIIKAIKNFEFEVKGTPGFRDAQVTAGGVPLCEIDFETMQSKKQKGLYIIGELLDVDGMCGGYNLHFAFSSALEAADSIINNK